MTMEFKIRFFILIIFGLAAVFAADESKGTQITNEINVRADTGGNVSDGGKITQGKSESSIKVETIINGQKVAPRDIKTEEGNISATSQIIVEDGKIKISQEVASGSEQKILEWEGSLDEQPMPDESGFETENEPTRRVEAWWDNFMSTVISFFRKFFSIS